MDTTKPVLDAFDQSILDDLKAQVAANEITPDEADRIAAQCKLSPLARSGGRG